MRFVNKVATKMAVFQECTRVRQLWSSVAYRSGPGSPVPGTPG